MNLVAGYLAWASWHVVGSTRPARVADGADPAGMRRRPPVLGAERLLQAHGFEVLPRGLGGAASLWRPHGSSILSFPSLLFFLCVE